MVKTGNLKGVDIIDLITEFITSRHPLMFLTVLIILDFFLGVSQAIVNNVLNSRKLTNGAIKNGSIILTTWILYYYLPAVMDVPVGIIMHALIMGQLVSLLENLGLMGVNLPPKVEEILKQLNRKE